MTNLASGDKVASVKLDDLSGKPLTYAEVGATAGAMPAGYHHLRKALVIGLACQVGEATSYPSGHDVHPGAPIR